jgi:type II secretory pathway predicted ATPase ExeA
VKGSSRARPRVTDDCWSGYVERWTSSMIHYRTDVHTAAQFARAVPLGAYAPLTQNVTVGARRERWSTMDQDQGPRTETNERPRGDSPLAVFSRRRALDRLRAAALAGQARPILITGEPGAGKTWLAHQVTGLLPSCWRWARVDLTRAMTPLDFLQLIGHSLGVRMANGLGAARARLDSILHDDDVDGKRWLLVVDEAHRGRPSVWDEIQALVNQSGRPSGFAAVVVLGDTELVRAFATREFGGLASGLRVHLHLPPLDLDEARELLASTGQDHVAAGHALEALHRDSQGNPGSLLRLAERRPAPWRLISDLPPDRASRDGDPAWPGFPASRTRNSNGPDQIESLDIEPPVSTPRVADSHLDHPRAETPSLIPAKPPIRMEEGLVEVGWDGDLESEFAESEDLVPTETRLADDSSFNEELIEDRYAALQAWTEWTESQKRADGRGVAIESPAPKRSAEPSSVGESPSAEEHSGSVEPAPATTPPGIRAEPQHEFAPYSQLFTRLRQSKQP